MVIDYIYDLYEELIEQDLQKSVSEEELDVMIDNGTLQDLVFKKLAKAFTVILFRNGVMEQIHAGYNDKKVGFTGIPDVYMKKINIDVCNRIYTIFKLLFSEDTYDYFRMNMNCHDGNMFSANWDDPKIEKSLVKDSDYIDSILNSTH